MSRVFYAAAGLVVVGALLVAVFGMRTRYGCSEEREPFTTSFQVADNVCNRVSPALAPHEPPQAFHRWGERIAIVAIAGILAVVLLWVGDVKRDRLSVSAAS